MSQIKRFENNDGVTILRLGGKLVYSTLENLKASLDTAMEKDHSRVVLNFKDVAVMDGFVAGLLASRAKSTRKKNGALVFCGLTSAFKHLLLAPKPDKPLGIYSTEDQACSSVLTKPGGSPTQVF